MPRSQLTSVLVAFLCILSIRGNARNALHAQSAYPIRWLPSLDRHGAPLPAPSLSIEYTAPLGKSMFSPASYTDSDELFPDDWIQGRVKQISYENIWPRTPEPPVVFIHTLEFDSTGRLCCYEEPIREQRPPCEQPAWHNAYEYDETGKLKRQSHYKGDQLRYCIEFEYDNLGRPNKRQWTYTYWRSASESSDSTPWHDAGVFNSGEGSNRHIEVEHKDGSSIETLYSDISELNPKISQQTITEENADGSRLIRILDFMNHSTCVRKINAHGLLESESFIIDNEIYAAKVSHLETGQLDQINISRHIDQRPSGEIDIQCRYECGTLKQVVTHYSNIETYLAPARVFTLIRTYEYDENGRVIRRITTTKPETLNHSQEMLEYEYDAHGNWITRTDSVIENEDPESQVSITSIIKRRIEYFKN